MRRPFRSRSATLDPEPVFLADESSVDAAATPTHHELRKSSTEPLVPPLSLKAGSWAAEGGSEEKQRGRRGRGVVKRLMNWRDKKQSAKLERKESSISPGTRIKTIKGWNKGDGGEPVVHYSEIEKTSWAMQPFLDKEKQDLLTIGEVRIKVLEARGLPAADITGYSDPYTIVTLTGKYFSHGQEWPEKHRFTARTQVIRKCLTPKWNEEFLIPVRRAGAVIQCKVFDWDRASQDDLLGCLEIPLADDLLSQKPVTRWYHLQPTLGDEAEDAEIDDAEQVIEEDDDDAAGSASSHDSVVAADSQPDGNPKGLPMVDESLSSPASGEGLNEKGEASIKRSSMPNMLRRSLRGSTRSVLSASAHPTSQPLSPEVVPPKSATSLTPSMIGAGPKAFLLRRKADWADRGELKLEIQYQFNTFAEFSSYMWYEPEFQPDLEKFSPNRLYRKAMRAWTLFTPYKDFVLAMNRVQNWEKASESFFWMILLFICLLFPLVGFMLLHLWLAKLVHQGQKAHKAADKQRAAGKLRHAAKAGTHETGTNDAELYNTGITNERQVNAATSSPKRQLFTDPKSEDDDVELQELEEKLMAERKFSKGINEIGRKVLWKHGPTLQWKIDSFARDIATIRRRVHPQSVATYVLSLMALLVHFTVQVTMYLRGWFNIYLAFLLLGRFTQKLYKKHGKHLVAGWYAAVESRQCQRCLWAKENPKGAKDTKVKSAVAAVASPLHQ
ncbi:unnamed protein product [Chrysoparadoxa australica]